VYINCNHWERDSGKLYEVLNHARLNESELIIGDCNARLGEVQLHGFDQQLVTSSLNEGRNAKDIVTDANGRHLMDLVELFGFTVVNGRSASDPLGDYTFMRGEARSTTDLCMARGTWIETIKDFQVISQIFSDHLPLEVTVILSTTSDASTAPLGLLPSLIWRNRKSENYRTKLDRNLATNCVADLISPDEIKGFLTECISKAVNNRGRRKPRDFKQEWYTEQCEAARIVSFNLLRQDKSTNAASAVVMYHEANAAYKLTCQNARTQFYINLARSLDFITDSRAYGSTIMKLNGNSFVKSMEVNADVLGKISVIF